MLQSNGIVCCVDSSADIAILSKTKAGCTFILRFYNTLCRHTTVIHFNF